MSSRKNNSQDIHDRGSWLLVDNKMSINKERYAPHTYGYKLSMVFENPERWDVVFQHSSGRIAILLEETKLNDGTFPLLQLLTHENEIIFESVTDLMFEWKIVSMINREFYEK